MLCLQLDATPQGVENEYSKGNNAIKTEKKV